MKTFLAAPLVGKISGANAIIVAAAISAALLTRDGSAETRMLVILGAALLSALVINSVLVYVALRPLRQLEATVERVWRGEIDARFPESLLADRQVARVGRTLNLLLDGLSDDRARMRQLANQMMTANETEKARIARALQDSAAQTLAALVFHSRAVGEDVTDPELAGRLAHINSMATDVLEEVRLLGETVYPRVLDDLGLHAALRRLGRQAEERDPTVAINIESSSAVDDMPAAAAAILYRVAEEGVTNAIRHGGANSIAVHVGIADDSASLQIVDDGRGFDVESAQREKRGSGLFGMRERLALAGGALQIDSNPGAGTRISAVVPIKTLSR